MTSKKSNRCHVQAATAVIGGKWKPGILFRLINRPYRLSELKREMPWISERVLIRQLKEMEADGIIVRTDYREVPPRVDYRMSAHGLTLKPVLEAFGAWGELHLSRLDPAQKP